MPPDEMLRLSLVAAAAVVVLAFVAGGFASTVGGAWRDGDRSIELHQLGPRVWGHCLLEGGGERYRGWVWLGRLTLDRYPFGAAHLSSVGFDPKTAPLVEGRATARLRLRKRGGELRGTFEGRKFTFAYQPARILRVAPVTPKERVWVRV